MPVTVSSNRLGTGGRNRGGRRRRENGGQRYRKNLVEKNKVGGRSEARLKGNEMFPGKISRFHSEKATNNIKTSCNKTLLLCVIIKDKNKIQFVMVDGNKIQK